MDFNKKILIVSALFLLCGCAITKRKVNKKRTKEIENVFSIESKKSKGEVIVLIAPKNPAKRFVDTIVNYKGERGSHVTTIYDKKGYIEAQVINCPDVVEEKKILKRTEKETKEKDTKREIDKKAIIIIIVLILIGIYIVYIFTKKTL